MFTFPFLFFVFLLIKRYSRDQNNSRKRVDLVPPEIATKKKKKEALLLKTLCPTALIYTDRDNSLGVAQEDSLFRAFNQLTLHENISQLTESSSGGLFFPGF